VTQTPRRQWIEWMAARSLPLGLMATYAATCLWGPGPQRGALAWPYPLLLPLKGLFDRLAPLDLAAAELLGAAGVWGVSLLLEKRLGIDQRHPLVAAGIGAVSWPLFLAATNGILYMTGIAWRGLPLD
jgi:hypothetical protein